MGAMAAAVLAGRRGRVEAAGLVDVVVQADQFVVAARVGARGTDAIPLAARVAVVETVHRHVGEGRMRGVHAAVDDADDDALALGADVRALDRAVPDRVCADPLRTRVGQQAALEVRAHGDDAVDAFHHLGLGLAQFDRETVRDEVVTVLRRQRALEAGGGGIQHQVLTFMQEIDVTTYRRGLGIELVRTRDADGGGLKMCGALGIAELGGIFESRRGRFGQGNEIDLAGIGRLGRAGKRQAGAEGCAEMGMNHVPIPFFTIASRRSSQIFLRAACVCRMKPAKC